MTFIALLLYTIPLLTLLTVDVRSNGNPFPFPLRLALALCWPAFCVFELGWDARGGTESRREPRQ